MEKIYLGKTREYGESVWLEKHKFDCGWYWAFGYIGNRNLHMHISSLIKHPSNYEPDWTNVSHQFKSTWLTQKQWWILRDLFLTCYTLKEAAAVYRHGSYNTSDALPLTPINRDMENKINADLESTLNNVWIFLSDAKKAWDISNAKS